MKTVFKTIFYFLLLMLTLTSCESTPNKNKTTAKKEKTTISLNTDSLTLNSYKTKNAIDSISIKLTPIKKLVQKINSKKGWNKKREVENSDAYKEQINTYYFKNDSLVKIDFVTYEVKGQQKNEYYIENGELIFCYENKVNYNRPIYYDSAEMIKNNDTVIFDVNKSVVNEKLSYFKNTELIHQSRSENDSTRLSANLLEQEKIRITEIYNAIKDAQ